MDAYDRQGNPITYEEFGELLADPDYKRVEATEIGPYWVSTVWLGLDHQWMAGGPPLIFETMVFSISQCDDPDELGLTDIDGYRWSTEHEARVGHGEVCTLVRATLVEDPEFGEDHSSETNGSS